MSAITASDSTTYDPPIMLLRVGSSGNLNVKDLEGNTVLISSVVAGEYVPGPFLAIMLTSTTASSLTGWRNE
jgi:hypothetical protein